tara:strand:+ start:173 stop:1441 length:1269 start_codon:yes stop_codon:yes gene_type:complete
MVNYSCERCGKPFTQKSHYDSHKRRKKPCVNNADKIKELVKIEVEKKINELNINTIINNSNNDTNTNTIINNSNNDTNNDTNTNINNKYDKEMSKEYLQTYLKSITNTKTKKYKRVTISPLRYAGGKSKAIGLILSSLPSLKEKKIVSPFFGGGSFEICISQHLGFEVIGYDIFGMLTNFWNVLIHHKDAFIKELETFEINKEEFTLNRHILLHYWDKIKPSDLNYKTKKKVALTDEQKLLLDDNQVIQAVYYYYNMCLSYGPMFLGWPSSNEIKPAKFKRRIKKLKEMNLKNLNVSCKDFKSVIQEHPNDFLFLDPPYYLGPDSKMFKGMYPNCNFAIHHKGFEHKEMCRLLKNHKGGFLITYNNCPTIREWYSDYTQTFPQWQYTYGQGETRIGKNRINNGVNHNIKESHEIFIICPPQK